MSNDDTIELSLNALSPNDNSLPIFPSFPQDDFCFIDLFGKGGNAQVFKAYHKRNHRFVALKQIPLKDSAAFGQNNQKRINMETSIVTTILESKNPLIPMYFLKYYGIYQDSHEIYIEMEPGLVTVNDLIEAGRSFSKNETLSILYDLSKSLNFLEKNGIANRDVKPGNVMLIPNSVPHVYDYKIYDFGIGCILDPNEKMTHRNSLLGFTPEYVAPELGKILGNYDNTTENYNPFIADVYSLGLMALKMIGLPYAEFRKTEEEIVDDYEDLGEILKEMFQRDPEARIGLQGLENLLEKVLKKKSILPPKIEKSYIEKAIRQRISKEGNRDYKQINLEYLEIFDKYISLGRMQEAGNVMEKAMYDVLIPYSFLKQTHEEVRCLSGMGLVYEKKGDLVWAERAFREALNISKQLLWDKEALEAETMGKVGAFYLRIGDYLIAEKLLEQAFNLNKVLYGEKHLYVGNTMRLLGDLYIKKKNYKKAFEMVSHAYQMINGLLYSENKPPNNQTLLNLTHSLNMNEIFYVKSLGIWEEHIYGENARQFPPNMMNIELLENRIGSLTSQEEFYLKAFKSRKQSWKKIVNIINGDLALVTCSLGRIHADLGDYKKAERLFIQALKTQERLFGEINGDVAKSYFNLAEIYKHLANLAKAEKLGLRGFSIRMRLFGEKNLEIFESMTLLESIYRKMGKIDLEKFYAIKGIKLARELMGGNEEKMKELIEMMRKNY